MLRDDDICYMQLLQTSKDSAPKRKLFSEGMSTYARKSAMWRDDVCKQVLMYVYASIHILGSLSTHARQSAMWLDEAVYECAYVCMYAHMYIHELFCKGMTTYEAKISNVAR